MNVFNRLRHLSLFDPSGQVDDLRLLREQVLNVILLSVSVFGTLALILNGLKVIPERDWLALGIFVAAYLGVLFSAANRRLPYPLRSTLIILIAFILGLVDLAQAGLASNALIWMFASVLLTSLLLGLKWTLINWLAQTLLLSGFAAFSPSISASLPLLAWLERISDYLLIGSIATIGLNLLVTGLERTLQTTRQSAANLEKEHLAMEQRTMTLERRLFQIRAVNEIAQTISGQIHSEDLLQQAAALIQEKLSFYFVGIFLTDQNGQRALLRAGTGEAGRKMLAESYHLLLDAHPAPLVSACITLGQPRIAQPEGTEQAANPHLPLTQSELALPLKLPSQVIGALNIHSAQPQAFDADDVAILLGLAQNLTSAIENARLLAESAQQIEELKTLYAASLSMYAATQGEDALYTIATYLLTVTATHNCVISSWDKEANEIVSQFGFSLGEPAADTPQTRYSLEEYPLTGEVLRQGRLATVRVDDPNADPAEVALMKTFDLKSLIMVPLVFQGRVVGLIELHDEQVCRDFSEQQIRMVEALSAQATLVIEMSALIEQNQKAASNERMINQITSKFQQTLDLESVLTTTITELSKALKLEEATIALGAEETFLGADLPIQPNGQDRTP